MSLNPSINRRKLSTEAPGIYELAVLKLRILRDGQMAHRLTSLVDLEDLGPVPCSLMVAHNPL